MHQLTRLSLVQVMTWHMLVPSHYLHQCWIIVNWTSRNKFHWNFKQNNVAFIHEKHLKMSSAKWQPFCLSLNVSTKAWGTEEEFVLGNELKLWEHWEVCFIKTNTKTRKSLHSEDNPPPPHYWLPILLGHVGSQVKRRQSQSYKLKEFAKFGFS